jgi:serine protease AprX
VTSELHLLDGVVAVLPEGEVAALASEPGVDAVVRDTPVSFESLVPGTSYDTATQSGSMATTASLVGAPSYWSAGYTGAGVDVAVVDTGVKPSPFLGNRLVARTDTTKEQNALSDGYGHGTHMASIIAGVSPVTGDAFSGIAPGARVVSVRVADDLGNSSLTQVLAGLDWVYQNRTSNGFHIKVVNLSLAVPALPSYVNDPLATSVERLGNAGVSVVAAVGNIGPGLGVVSPAYDPSVIANDRRPDILAPGRSIQSVVISGSYIDDHAPASSLIGVNYVVGSGTSQAAARHLGRPRPHVPGAPGAQPGLAEAAHHEPLHPDGRRRSAGRRVGPAQPAARAQHERRRQPELPAGDRLHLRRRRRGGQRGPRRHPPGLDVDRLDLDRLHPDRFDVDRFDVDGFHVGRQQVKLTLRASRRRSRRHSPARGS